VTDCAAASAARVTTAAPELASNTTPSTAHGTVSPPVAPDDAAQWADSPQLPLPPTQYLGAASVGKTISVTAKRETSLFMFSPFWWWARDRVPLPHTLDNYTTESTQVEDPCVLNGFAIAPKLIILTIMTIRAQEP
jgi:hypothetical protein